jgi:alpha-tubulin suppressor-like RCC1 family protein
MSPGGTHTCGVTTAGVAYCWGWNFYGEVGDGTTTLRRTPVAVAGGLLFRFSPGSSSLSGVHSCGVTTDDVAYCWGYNFYGQLGDGSTTDRSTPSAVADPL